MARRVSRASITAASFIDEDCFIDEEEPPTPKEKFQKLRSCGVGKDHSAYAQFVFSHRFEVIGGCVVLFNFIVITLETQARATNDEPVLRVMMWVNRCLLFYYIVEFCFRLHVLKLQYFCGAWNLLDFFVVLTGVIGEILEMAASGGSGIAQLGMLKSLRVLRLVRLIRLLVAFQELYILLAGVARCMRTLFWASGLIFMALNVWSILSVEFLDGKIKELSANGEFRSCTWCPTAFENIWLANLTWWQIITGDGWSQLGRPLVETHVWPLMFFLSCIIIVVWGLLNLIIAAIVDTSIAAREDDIASAAKMALQSRAAALANFTEVCHGVDMDGSGEITLEEFRTFLASSTELQQHLAVMGIREKDLDVLLNVIDRDGSGLLETEEFVSEFTEMRTLVTKTTLFYLLRHVQGIDKMMELMNTKLEAIQREVLDMKHECAQRGKQSLTARFQSEPSRLAEQPAETKAVHAPLQSECSHVPLSQTSPAYESKHHDGETAPLPGWYYFGNTPPLDCTTFWKHLSPTSTDIAPIFSKEETTDSKRNHVEISNFTGAQQTFGVEILKNLHEVQWKPIPPSDMSINTKPCWHPDSWTYSEDLQGDLKRSVQANTSSVLQDTHSIPSVLPKAQGIRIKVPLEESDNKT